MGNSKSKPGDSSHTTAKTAPSGPAVSGQPTPDGMTTATAATPTPTTTANNNNDHSSTRSPSVDYASTTNGADSSITGQSLSNLSSAGYTIASTTGGSISRENAELAQKSHFTEEEVNRLREQFEAIGDHNYSITRSQFSRTVANFVQCWSAGNVFLERLFDAFDVDGDQTVDFREFINGLSVFVKGTPEEKLELSFKLYDINKDGFITQKELAKVMTQIYSTFYVGDQAAQIKELVKRIFDDLDVNDDGQLSIQEYKLMALKEPLIVDFLQQFLAEKPPI